jgi:hypothetical protein
MVRSRVGSNSEQWGFTTGEKAAAENPFLAPIDFSEAFCFQLHSFSRCIDSFFHSLFSLRVTLPGTKGC